MSLTKAEVVNRIFEKFGGSFSNRQAQEVVEVLLEIIKSTLENGEDVMISNFGKWSVKEKSARRGRNPATEEDMILPARRVVTFRSSGRLREKLNNRN